LISALKKEVFNAVEKWFALDEKVFFKKKTIFIKINTPLMI